MKKLLSLITTIVIVLALPVFSVSAAYDAELTVSKSEAKTGETTEILINIANNPGLCALGFEIEYDKDTLKVISAEFTELFSAASKRVNTQDEKITFNAANADNINGDGAVAKIVFKVTAAEFRGTSINVKPLGDKGFVLHSEADHSLVDVTLKLYSGAILPPAGTVTDTPVTDIPTTGAPVTTCVHSNTVSETVKASTCSIKGVTLTRCADCGVSLGEKELPLAEHAQGEWEIVTEPTADKAGEAVQKCTICGQMLATKTLEKLAPATSDNSTDSTANTDSLVPEEPDTDNGNSAVILIVLAAVAVAGSLIAFAIYKAKADKKKREADFF